VSTSRLPVDMPSGTSPVLDCSAAKGLALPLMSIAIAGTVDYSNMPPALGVKVGTPVAISFYALLAAVDRRSADDPHFVVQDSMSVYPICNETFSFSAGPVSAKMGGYVVPPFPVPAWMEDATFFSVASKRPTLDNIFVSPSPYASAPLPLLIDGVGELYPKEFQMDFNLVYSRGTIASTTMPKGATTKFSAEGLLKKKISLATTYFPSNTVLSISLDSITVTSDA